ncbi:histone deacetylase family protein [Salinisphaera sp. Q1T1-3]|uniref:histone deacetylase family protein n=1 Tax=Salinisphaera sp. Q1T1-3 TaxID=2321229 RepID=UPI000E7156C3|nr:histone deacetylase family protein [Salinisphaera sp. Q1T1-3]RJS93302.1 histone deacetylase family protein [Salinisphaera sp. Q1T1-3]
MQIVHTEDSKRRAATTELSGGHLVAPFESPARVDQVIAALRARDSGPIVAPTSHGMAPIAAVHDAGYIDFLASAWDDWVAAGNTGEIIPTIWPTRRLGETLRSRHIEARVGYYALAGETSIEAQTYEAARTSADIALSALDHVLATGAPAFGLCRPPGHHAAVDQFGGYSFFNNAAIAAESARQRGVSRVAILDVDFHHGNGTQQIFYERADVSFVSLHGDPVDEFPYFSGFADERGAGPGLGYNRNHPLPPGTDYVVWSGALDAALAEIAAQAPALLIVSLGTDIFKDDPISSFTLDSDDFVDCGARIAALGLPSLFLLEGGYAVAAIGTNIANTLAGFEAAWRPGRS